MPLLIAAAMVFILVPQGLVYGKNPWMAGRYLVPGNLFALFATAVGLYYLSRGDAVGRRTIVRRVFLGVLVAIALVNVARTHREATAQAVFSRAFQARLNDIVRLAGEQPDAPLLVCSATVFDREPIVAVANFLSVRLPTDTRLYLKTSDWEQTAVSPVEKRLAALLTSQSLNGDTSFSRIADFRAADGHCIGVVVSGAAGTCPCRYAVRVMAE